MAVDGLPAYSEAKAKREWHNSKCRKSKVVDLEAGQKFAVVLLRFDASATRADYASMASTVKSHAKIDDVELLVDGQVPTVEAAENAVVAVTTHIQVNKVT